MKQWHTSDEAQMFDPEWPYKSLTAQIDAITQDPQITGQILSVLGHHALVLGSERMLSPILKTYGIGISKQAAQRLEQMQRASGTFTPRPVGSVVGAVPKDATPVDIEYASYEGSQGTP